MGNVVKGEKEESMKILNSEANYLKSWAVQVPVKPLYAKGSHQRKSYRFNYSYMRNWLLPLDGSMDRVYFLLDCFVVSAGLVQLGRYHPKSDPESFVRKYEDTWSVNSDDDYWAKIAPPHMNKDAGTWPEDMFENYLPQVDQSGIINSREMSEMERVLNESMEHIHDLRHILDLLPDDPVSEFNECGICLESQWIYRQTCCQFAACSTCLQSYYSAKVDYGQVKILCCNSECNTYVHRDEVSSQLSGTDKTKFHNLLILANQDSNLKTCPRCSHLTTMFTGQNKDNSITCPSCHLNWCFDCHAPWHGTFSCKQFRKGDRLLRSWARERNHGQLNAQKCPRCKIYIQRTTGCDHMHCTRCKTDFCYKCGERFRYLKFFGDHYTKLSVFGCKYRFKADQPLQRNLIRGAIFGGKLIAAPVLGALALCAGAVAVGISLFALPVYCGVRLYKHCEGRQTIKMATTNLSHS